MFSLADKGIEVVFFDVGNTLFKPHPSMEAICRHVLEQFGYTVRDEEIRLGMIAADRFYDERYRSDDSFWSNETDTAAMWSELYAAALGEMGVDGDRHFMGRAIYDYFGHGDRWRTYPDVEPVFELLKSTGHRLGLISNWDARLAKLCFDMGLDRYLDSVLSSASVGLIKPDPGMFETACERLNVEPRRAVHVGDQYFADILGARGAGLNPVMIDRWEFGHRADVPVIKDLYELLPILGLEGGATRA